jgi:hypothetical protein
MGSRLDCKILHCTVTTEASAEAMRCQESAAKWPEAEFLGVIGTKVLRVFLLAIYSHLY